MSNEKLDKRHSKGQATRLHILEVAKRLFVDIGYEATSIEAILAACGISRGALYHHFENKEQLFEAVFEAIEQDVTAMSIEATKGQKGPVEILRAGCVTFLKAAQRDDFRQIALIDAPSVLGWKRWREIESRYGLGLLKAALAAAVGASGKKTDTVDQAAHLLLASLIEASLLIASAKDKKESLRACTTAIDKMLEGIMG